jgi:alpha-tubulin suppressor-like RCC1 family protein
MNATRPSDSRLAAWGRHGGSGFVAPVTSVDELQRALAAGNNVLIAVRVLAQSGWDTDGRIHAPAGGATCECDAAGCTDAQCQQGGHAILVVGYTTDVQGEVWFEFLNSWTSSWGTGGYGTMSATYLRNYAYAGAYLSTTRDRKLVLHSPQTGYYNGCAVNADGVIWCWGHNGSGELGHSSEMCLPQNWPCTTQPLPMADAALSFSKVHVGTDFSCGIATDGTTWCWGSNLYGQLGAGLPLGTHGPTAVAAGSNVYSKFSVNLQGACGIRATDGRLFCWGNNTYGQLGNGGLAHVAQPQESASALYATNGPFLDVSTGSHTCVLDKDHKAWCWGMGARGELGVAATTLPLCNSQYCSTTPIQVPTTVTFSAIEAGAYHTCGLAETTGEAYCWGDNSRLQLGATRPSDPTPMAIDGGRAFVSVTSKNMHTCGLTSAGTAYCWGMGNYGSLGDGSGGNITTVAGHSSLPVAVGGGIVFGEIDAGEQTTCGVSVSGAGYCWGSGNLSALGARGKDTCVLALPAQQPYMFPCALTPQALDDL